eukprot:CAMPEP_0179074004 /NCGR_PEP_ID=MMETSP0796-20121207/32863_1 /TAXON_ID=73915 /ORGANISM="Pyrodinium bahamense, Strain pbaha01" /LENGTH=359 /DNA_ID=CAMNT_0020771215 /DNA_START=53 /DNA_END=1129 /DNA_ORIENTATION=+
MGNGLPCCAFRNDKPEGLEDTANTVVAGSFEDAQPSIPTLEAKCVVQCQNDLGESVVWCSRQQRLFWLDLAKNELWSLDPVGGAVARQEVEMGWQGGCLALREQGGFVISSALGIGLLDCAEVEDSGPKLQPKIVCHPIKSAGLDPTVVRLNDGRVDPQGRLVVGSFHKSYRDFSDDQGHIVEEKLPDQKDLRGSVYRISVTSSVFWGKTGQIEVLLGLGKVSVANGAAFAQEDGQHVMYFVDTPTRRVRCFKYGDALSGELFVTEPVWHQGGPDGACVDSDGGYWIAEYGGGRVLRIKDGSIDKVVCVGAPKVTCCAFGGPDLDTLYITTARRKDPDACEAAGGLFACQVPGCRGVPE